MGYQLSQKRFLKIFFLVGIIIIAVLLTLVFFKPILRNRTVDFVGVVEKICFNEAEENFVFITATQRIADWYFTVKIGIPITARVETINKQEIFNINDIMKGDIIMLNFQGGAKGVNTSAEISTATSRGIIVIIPVSAERGYR